MNWPLNSKDRQNDNLLCRHHSKIEFIQTMYWWMRQFVVPNQSLEFAKLRWIVDFRKPYKIASMKMIIIFLCVNYNIRHNVRVILKIGVALFWLSNNYFGDSLVWQNMNPISNLPCFFNIHWWYDDYKQSTSLNIWPNIWPNWKQHSLNDFHRNCQFFAVKI